MSPEPQTPPPPRPPPAPPYAPATLTVLGTAAARTEPDEAILWIRLSALDDSPGRALADVAQRSERLVGLLDGHGVAKPDRSTTGVRIEEEFDHTKEGRRSLGHRATAAFAIRLTHSELIGPLITSITADVQASLDGPRWSVSEAHPARLDAARQAAADAKRRAAAYAQGAGAKLGRLVGLVEPGTSSSLMRRAKMVPSGGLHSMPVEAGELDVRAVIEATFALEP